MTKFRLLACMPILMFLLMGSVHAAQGPDSLYRFQFRAGSDGLYTSQGHNEQQLKQLISAINEHRNDIDAGKAYLKVESFGIKASRHASAKRVAYRCRSRVKSVLIVRAAVKEENFRTSPHNPPAFNGEENIVVVTLVLPTTPQPEPTPAPHAEAPKPQPQPKQEPQHEPEPAPRPTPVSKPRNLSLNLRANLLRWATLTPDLGIELRLYNRVGLLLNGTYTYWMWSNQQRNFALWEVAPELRYYFNMNRHACYIGGMFKMGQFNYKLSEIGKQGKIMGGGISAGYMYNFNRHIALDCNIAAGALKYSCDPYTTIGEVHVRKAPTKNDIWWGPINAAITLVWTPF